jgi:hypothetical protein
MKKILIPVLLGILAIAACKKDKKENEKSKWEMITTGRWKITEAKLSASGGEQDFLEGAEPCSKDNTYMFNTSGTVSLDEGLMKCSEADSQTRTDGSWILSADSTMLTLKETSITQGFGDLSANIIMFNSSTLKLKKDTTIVIGTSTFSGTFYATFTNTK